MSDMKRFAYAASEPALLLGIDLGTSACKVSAFDLDGSCVAHATGHYPLLTPEPGRVEQDPRDWWKAVVSALRELTAMVNPDRIVGIGLSGQSWSAVLVDNSGEVLANTPIWMDTSSSQLCAEIGERLDQAEILKVSGNSLRPSYTTGKILLLARAHPEIYRDTAHILQSNAFIGLRLTGEVSQDRCQAYGLHVFDTSTGEYDQDMAAALGIDLAKLPRLVDCHEVIGQVSAHAAAQTGLRRGTPVVAGGLDAACAAFGAGVWQPGEVQEQGGQAGGMSIVTDHPVADPRLILSRHVVPGRWLLQGGTVAGGASLRWARDQLGLAEWNFDDINTAVADVSAGADGVWYLPYLSGERSPLWDPAACGVFFGLRLSTTRAALFRAVMEGVAYSLLDNILVAAQAGAPCERLIATGGAAASSVWTQIKADVTACTIQVSSVDQPSTLGAALLAGVGVGAYPNFEAAASVAGGVAATHIPGHSQTIYADCFPVYRELYTSLKPLMSETFARAQKGH